MKVCVFPKLRLAAVLCAGVVAVGSEVEAVTITHDGNSVTMDFVDIGYAGNAADTADGDFRSGIQNYYGAVAYDYSIGKFEVTADQWATVTGFDNLIENNPNEFWSGSQPTANVSWYEAAKFANWLTSGDALQGAYQFSDANTFTGVDRATAQSTYSTTYVLPTEDEWYKAAYFKSDGSGYTLYATGDSVPIAGTDANFLNVIGSPWDVGSGSVENNGTYDMGGNVWEWNESAFAGGAPTGDETRVMRGGGRFSTSENLQQATRDVLYPDYEYNITGFRVASLGYSPKIDLLGATAKLRYLWDGDQGYGRDGLPPGLTPFKGTIEVSSFDLGTNDFATLQWAYTPIDLSVLNISEETVRLYWFDEANDLWVLAGEESNNTPNGGQFVLGGPTNNLGDWGLDMDNNFAWANIDHASEYALVGLSLNFVPEPSSAALLGLGGLAVMLRRRRF